jgi:hypothetical protein
MDFDKWIKKRIPRGAPRNTTFERELREAFEAGREVGAQKGSGIIETLQRKNNRLRIEDGYRWLIGDGDGGWIVYEYTPRSQEVTIIIETESESEAVLALLEENDE